MLSRPRTCSAQPQVTLHGGEPLLAGPGFMRYAGNRDALAAEPMGMATTPQLSADRNS